MRALKLLVLPLFLVPALLALSPSVAAAQPSYGSTVLSLQQDSSDLSADDELRYASREMRVRVWHDKDDDEVYERGEELSLYFRSNQDSYVVMYRIDADGYTEVLWPTSRYDDGFVFGGHTYSVPGRGAEIPLRVSNAKGVEYVETIASQYPFDLRELALDFRFDMEEVTDYAHQVSGDPFLAVNDINYAITGLEEDVDWIITDWTHIYIDEQVEYARYACNSCHTGEDQQYSPYTESCTQVTIYNDWGWHRRWYTSFGYYPLYCDAPYYYWDRWYSRPYYYNYYPVYYSWPSYPIYVRPYPVYSWRTHTSFNGDYLTYYGRGRTSSPPLYDIDRAREGSKNRDRGPTRTPPSVATRGSRGAGVGTVDQGLLVRDTAPLRSRDDRDPGTLRGHSTSTRVGVRTGRPRPTRTVRSLQSEEVTRRSTTEFEGRRVGTFSGDAQVPSNSGRRWTRPVVRNERDSDPRNSNPTGSRVNRGSDRNRDTVRPTRELRSGSLPSRRDSGSTPQRGEVRPPQRRESSSTPARRTVQPRDSGDRGNRRTSEARPARTNTNSRRASEVRPPARTQPRESSPRRSVSPPPRRSSQSGGTRTKSVSSPRRSPPPQKAPVRSGSRAGSSRGSRAKSGGSRGGRG